MRLLKLDDSIKIKIYDAISRIDNTIEKHNSKFDLCESDVNPGLTEIESCGAFLQSFYNGIENIIVMIFKNINEYTPNDAHWHTNLLDKAFEANKNKMALFNNKYKDQMDDYKNFRHIFRHIYGEDIDWDDVKSLIKDLKTFWKDVKSDINNFINNYDLKVESLSEEL